MKMTNWTEELSDEHKEQIWHVNVETVKEIREQIAQDIEATNGLWKQTSAGKSRKTQKAFAVSAAIARGQNEKL
jgi:hypothetical protein